MMECYSTIKKNLMKFDTYSNVDETQKNFAEWVPATTKEEYDAAKKAIKARAARSATTRDTANPEIENEGK